MSVEVDRILPAMLLRLYLARTRGEHLSRRDLCEPLPIDPRKTGARYVSVAEAAGLFTVDRKKQEKANDTQ